MSDIPGNPPAINQNEKVERLFWEAETALLDIEEIINGPEGYNEWVMYERHKKYIHRILNITSEIIEKANKYRDNPSGYKRIKEIV